MAEKESKVNVEGMTLDELKEVEQTVRTEKKKHSFAGIYAEARKIPVLVKAMKEKTSEEKRAILKEDMQEFAEAL